MSIEILDTPGEHGPHIPEHTTPPTSAVIFDASDPRNEQLSREDRIRMYYARELAAGNLDVLGPRYRCSEYGDSNDPYQDFLVADPLSDPQVSELASILKALGYKSQPESGDF